MQSIKEIPVKLTQLFDTVHHTKKIEKGTFLFQEGSAANELYIVQSGIIQISIMMTMLIAILMTFTMF